MGELIRARDWSRTPLGPMREWPQSLLTAVSICLDSRFPIVLYWGPECIVLYNDAYSEILSGKHPRALGNPCREVWAEIWDTIGPMLVGVTVSGEATWSEDERLILERHGYPEECYFTFSFSPVEVESGVVGGIFTAVAETTQRVVGNRRLSTIGKLAERTGAARTTAEAGAAATRALADNPLDVPFALLYLLGEDEGEARLIGTAGLEAETFASPAQDPPSNGTEPGRWPLEQVARSGVAERVGDLEARFGARPPGVWEDPPHTALVLPVARPGQERPDAILVAGVSSRRALDDDYRAFFELVVGQIASGIANARAREEERERAEKLAELDRVKTAFFSNVSHEFRTPLTLMLGPLQDVLDGSDALAPDVREELEVIRRNGLRLLKLVNTLLDFSRIEAERLEASYEPTDLCALTAELASMFRSAMENAGLRLEVDAPGPLPPVYVDRGMWEKIVMNLLSNALKFTFEGRVTVRLRAEGEHVELGVSDTGTGIAPEQLPHLFERFHRVRGVRSRTHEGSGIGLALVQEMVKLHGGSVRVESVEGEGSTFTVSVPTGAAHLPPEHIRASRTAPSTPMRAAPYLQEALRWSMETGEEKIASRVQAPAEPAGGALRASPPPRTNERPGSDVRILVADDNADMRDYLRRMLGAQWTVEVVGDGSAALASVRERRPDLILADVMMPGLDGFELLREVRADPRTGDVPLLLLSARAGEESTVEGIEAGADDYLIKPFSGRELLARVRTHLDLARVRREAAERERELRAEAEAANRAKAEFLATMSHELRTPLNGIIGYADLLGAEIAGPLTRDQQQHLGRIEAGARHLIQLIEEILTFSRLEARREEVHPEEVNAAGLARDTAALIEPLPRAKGLGLRVHTPERPLSLETDPGKLRQILLNLLSNAVKFTEAGEVRLEVSDAGADVVFTVSDTGIGIPPGELERIFEPFHQSGRSMTHPFGGTGLGLSVSRQLARLLGGDVEAQSTPGVGSTFTVRLPRHMDYSAPS